MHPNPEVASLYKIVIEDVIKNVRSDFLNMGIDEQILFELHDLWEAKLLESKVLARNFESNFFNASTSAMMQASQSMMMAPDLQQQQQQQFMGQNGRFMALQQQQQQQLAGYYMKSSTADGYYHQPQPGMMAMGGQQALPVHGAGQPQQQQYLGGAAAHLANLAAPQFADYQAQQQQPQQPQQSQQPPQGPATIQPQLISGPLPQHLRQAPPSNPQSTTFHQLDGNMDHEEPVLGFSGHQSSGSQKDELLPNEEDMLGSDLDDEEDDDEAAVETDNIVLCQYDKASRTKSKWTCSFKDGIIHINGLDYALHRATGKFEWI